MLEACSYEALRMFHLSLSNGLHIDKRSITSSVANHGKLLQLHASSVTVDLASSRIFLPTGAAAWNQSKLRLMGRSPKVAILQALKARLNEWRLRGIRSFTLTCASVGTRLFDITQECCRSGVSLIEQPFQHYLRIIVQHRLLDSAGIHSKRKWADKFNGVKVPLLFRYFLHEAECSIGI
jgi:hypothetical protein